MIVKKEKSLRLHFKENPVHIRGDSQSPLRKKRGWKAFVSGFSRKEAKEAFTKSGGRVISISSTNGGLLICFECKTTSNPDADYYPRDEFMYLLKKNLGLLSPCDETTL